MTDRTLPPLVGDRIGNYPEQRDHRDVAPRFVVIVGSERRGKKMPARGTCRQQRVADADGGITRKANANGTRKSRFANYRA
jgi:hypothetical protein